MDKTLKQIFKTKKPIIGMIHFPPLVGYPEFPGIDYITKKAIREVKILSKEKVDAIMVENNYDTPHKEFVAPEITAMIAYLTNKVCQNTNLPVGISTLWNDYKTSLGVCATTRASFIRIPAFIDTVDTSYGLMKKRSKEATALRKKLNLNHVAILADVQVKHSEMINRNKSLSQSIKEAIRDQADAIIITGRWTGDSPKLDDLEIARESAGNKFPILIGSGATKDNVKQLLKYANGIIVGTAIKKGKNQSKKQETNLKPFQYTISPVRARQFTNACKQHEPRKN